MLTDRQLMSVFDQSIALSDSNGRHCSRILNGGTQDQIVCTGRTLISNGVVVFAADTGCNKPCQFRADALMFSIEVERVKMYERIIEAAKKAHP